MLKGIALGDDDPDAYTLAFELGWSHSQVEDLPNEEYERMRAYMTWAVAQRKHKADVAAARAKR